MGFFIFSSQIVMKISKSQPSLDGNNLAQIIETESLMRYRLGY